MAPLCGEEERELGRQQAPGSCPYCGGKVQAVDVQGRSSNPVASMLDIIQSIAPSSNDGREMEETYLQVSRFVPPDCLFPLKFLIQGQLQISLSIQVADGGIVFLDLIDSFRQYFNLGLDMPKARMIPRLEGLVFLNF
ncbi:hypothetical protein RJ639_037121 [Escallonia herrerae]|uniref:Uncharacterized protein n=1 Tax=Escallonia herrerae TaxID=1293975 RepID=A0AA88WWJ2_9ASTE|nr:hypothetical protein RJ639_037121 [Escallonia herrerae]